MQWKTAISHVNNDEETIRGYGLRELVEKKLLWRLFFLLLKGDLPEQKQIRMLNALFTTAIDHGIGAPSTMAARISASTGNSLHTSLAAGILSFGKYHGNAIEGAAQFFQQQCDAPDLKGLLLQYKIDKKRVMGFGHKLLTVDKRASTLLAMARECGIYGKYSEFAEQVEDTLNSISSKKLPMNVDGAMAAIISDMGFDWRMAQGFFIIARMPGLVAHVYEEMTGGEGLRRLAEGEDEYVGVAKREL